LGFGGCGKFGADFGCQKFEVCTGGKYRVDSGVTTFENVFKANLRLIWKGLLQADLLLILGGTHVPFEGVFEASLKVILRIKKLG
jgi:hypothetical protein